MIYEKDGVRLINNNPVCDSLFIKQGWIPVDGEVEVKGNPTEIPQNNPATKRTTKTSK